MDRCPVSHVTQMHWSHVQSDPHGTFARHRREHWYAPIAGADLIEVLTYADAKALLADDAHMREYLFGHLDDMMRANPNLNRELIGHLAEKSRRALINLDGEPHVRLRLAVARAFTPRSVAALRPALEQMARELAFALAPGDDFMDRFARILPARGLCLLTGIPDADHERFAAWIDTLQVTLSPTDLLSLTPEESDRVLAVQREFDAYTRALVESRRLGPRDDLVSRLAADEAQLDTETVAGLLGDLISAGNDTTRKALGLMVLTLAAQSETWERVAADPSYATAAVEEVLRLETPAPGPVRRAACDLEHRGETLVEGQVAALSIWSGNRDEAFWGADANAFDPAREPAANHHLSFGHGAHFCLGASLAREELRAALVALAGQVTDVRVVEAPPMTAIGGIYGPLALRIGFRRREALP